MSLRVHPLVLALFAAEFAMCCAFVLTHQLLPHGAFLVRFFDLDGEANLAAWFGSAQWLIAGLLFGHFAWRRFKPAAIRSWVLLALPALFFLLSLDEVAQLHEGLGRKSDALLPNGSRHGTVFSTTGIWTFVLGLPFAALLLGLLAAVRPYFRAHRAVLPRVLIGMFVMLVGAIGMELFSNFVDRGTDLWMLQIMAEEVLEMVGATLVLWAGLDLRRAPGRRRAAGAALATTQA